MRQTCAAFAGGEASDAGFKALHERTEKKRNELQKKEEGRAERTPIQRTAGNGHGVCSAISHSRSLPLFVVCSRDSQADNLIDMPNLDGSLNLYVPRFDPKDATGRILIMCVFLYPDHAMSDEVPIFVEDTKFSAVLVTCVLPPHRAHRGTPMGGTCSGCLWCMP